MFPNNMFPNNMFLNNMFPHNMFPSKMFPIQPPNSRCSSPVDETEFPHCLQKTEKPDEEMQITFSTTIDALPDEILLYIFKFLSIDEKLQAQIVCSKWQQLVKSDILWKKVFIGSTSPIYFMGCLLSLPPCVHYIEIESFGSAIPLSFPEVMYKIHERCPHLKSLEIVNVNFKKNLLQLDESYNEESDSLNNQSIQESDSLNNQSNQEPDSLNNQSIQEPDSLNNQSIQESDSLNNQSIQESNSLINQSDRKRKPFVLKFVYEIKPSRKQILMQSRLESKFCKEENFGLLNAPLPELRFLSLSQIVFNDIYFSSYSTLFPKLVVLNLSYSMLPDLKDDLFSALTELEELYIEGCYVKEEILQNVLKNSKKLKILDLESSCAGDNIIEICKQYGASIEKLYLANTGIGDISKNVEDGIFFPRLQSLCVKYSNVTERGIEELLKACPSLKCVNTSFCENLSRAWYNEILPKDLKKRVIFVENANYYRRFGCSHFRTSKFDILSM